VLTVVVLAVVSMFLLNNGLRWLTNPAETGFSSDQNFAYDYSFLLLLVVPFVIFIMINWQGRSNENNLIYPQTNTSRFLAELAYYRIVLVAAIGTALFLHLLQHVLVLAFSAQRPDLYLAYSYTVGFLLLAAFVVLIFLGMTVSILSFLAMLIRASGLDMSIPLVILSVLMFFVSFLGISVYPVVRLASLELNVGLFLLVGCLTWFTFFVSAVALNKRLVQTYASKTSAWARYTATAFFIFAAIFTGLAGASIELTTPDDIIFPPHADEIIVDASQLPAGESIIIKEAVIRYDFGPDSWGESTVFMLEREGEGFVIGEFYDGELQGIRPEYWHWPDGAVTAYAPDDYESVFVGDRIIISYQPPFYTIDNPELLAAVNPEIIAYLDGNILILEYDFVRGNTIAYLPMWRLMEIFNMRSAQIAVNKENPEDAIIPNFQWPYLSIRAE